MRVLLLILFVVALLAGGGIFSAAKSAIHEIEAFILSAPIIVGGLKHRRETWITSLLLIWRIA